MEYLRLNRTPSEGWTRAGTDGRRRDGRASLYGEGVVVLVVFLWCFVGLMGGAVGCAFHFLMVFGFGIDGGAVNHGGSFGLGSLGWNLIDFGRQGLHSNVIRCWKRVVSG